MEVLNAKLVKQRDQEIKPKLRGFHSGVGYSSASGTNEKGSRNLWDSKDAKQAQLAQDKMSSDLVDFAKVALADISHFLVGQQPQMDHDDDDDDDDEEEELAEECARMTRVFENASLAYFLARELKICDFNNMADRAEYYTSLLECVLVFHETLVPTLKENLRAAFEKYDNMRDIVQQAKTFLHVTEAANAVEDKYEEREQEEIVLENLAKLIVRVGTAIEANAIVDLTKDDDAMTTTRGTNKRKKIAAPESREKNLEKNLLLRAQSPGFQFDNFVLADSSHYKDKLLKQATKPNAHAIARAVAGISGSLPLSVSPRALVSVTKTSRNYGLF